MKRITTKMITIVSLSICLLSACSSSKVSIPAKQSITMDYSEYEAYSAHLRNRSLKEVAISVTNKKTEKQIRGFQLNGRGNAKVIVERENQLVLSNTSGRNMKIRVDVEKAKRPIAQRTGKISFTLENKGAKSIPLIIPTVMNPNLSPFSKSGVSLKIGQQILFKAKGKKHVLFTVDETIEEGGVVNVTALLKKRKEELNL